MRAGRLAPGSEAWLLTLCLARVGTFMVYISYAAALPVLQREWQMSGTAAGSIASSFQLAYALSLLVSSELADRLGARRGRAMGILIGAHSLALALALVLTGIAIPRGGSPLAFLLTSLGPVAGGVLAWAVVRDTPDRVAARAGGERFVGAVLRNRPAMLVIAGYTWHSWEVLGMWAWTPAFLAASLAAAGAGLSRAAGLGSYLASSFHLTGMVASLVGGVIADRLGRTPVILAMASLSTLCSAVFGWLLGAPGCVVVGVGLVYGFSTLGDSPIYSAAITEVVAPAYRGAALALRSLAGYGAGAVAPLVFGWVLDVQGGAEGWGWAFGTLAAAGALAVVATAILHRLPEARALTVGTAKS